MELLADILFFLNLIVLVISLAHLMRVGSTIAFYFMLIIYFLWSIFGFKIFLELSKSGENHHLESELFDVSVDSNFLLSEMLMSFFFLVLCVGVCFLAKKNRPIDHGSYSRAPFLPLLFTTAIVIGCLYKTVGILSDSIDFGFSAYEYARFYVENSAYQFFRDLGMILSVIYLFFFRHDRKIVVFYFFGCYLLLALSSIAIGDRSSIAVTFILGFILYFDHYGWRLFRSRSFLLIVLLLLILLSLASLRGVGIYDVTNYELEGVVSIWNFIPTTEFLAANMSLYGVLLYEVPLLWGGSFVNLLNSLISFLGLSNSLFLPEYLHYSSNVGVHISKGFTIHHVTSWYLNFWVFGPPLAAVSILSILYVFKSWARSNVLGYLGLCIYCALTLLSARSGIEAYKGIIIYTVIFPLVAVKLLSIRVGYFRLGHN